MPAREILILILVLLITLAPMAGARQPEAKWRFDGFSSNESAGELPRHPRIPISESTLNFWISDLEFPDENARQLRQIHDAMTRSIEVAWITASERVSDIKHLNEHNDDESAVATKEIYKLTTAYHEFVNTQTAEFLADIPLLLSTEHAARWEASERVRWRRRMLECAAIDHVAVNLPEMLGPTISALEPPARDHVRDILATHIARIDPILEAAEAIAVPLTRIAQEHQAAEWQRELADDAESEAKLKERMQELSSQIAAAVPPLIRHYEDIRNIIVEDADRLRPLLPPDAARDLDATLRTPSDVEFAPASLGSPRYTRILYALGEDLTGTHLYLGSGLHEFYASHRTTRPAKPLSERQRRDIAEITEWHRDQQQRFVDEMQRLLPGIDYLNTTVRHRRFSRDLRISSGTLHFVRHDFGKIDDATKEQQVVKLLREQAAYEAEAVKRLRQHLTLEQRMLVARH